jgi:hypothetical protein
MVPLISLEVAQLAVQGLVAIAVVLTLYIYYKQLRTMDRQLRAMEREVAARMRPWVGMFGFEFVPALAPDNSDVVRVLLRNSGALPAQRAMLTLVLRPKEPVSDARDEPVNWEETGVKAFVPGEEGNYGIRLSQYPQFTIWRQSRRDVVVEGLMKYSMDDRQFQSRFLAELRFSEETDADGRVRTRWRNQEIT